MKMLSCLALTLSLLGTGVAHADEVLAETGDTTAGAAFGAGTGLMIGAVGGPLGALLGAGVGFMVGQGVQRVAGLEERAYRVRTASGEEQTLRSPTEHFAIGQQVEQHGRRLHATAP